MSSNNFKLKVYYEDTDAGGIVYYANYLKYLERARTELINNKGLSNKILKEKFNIFLVVRSCTIDFIKPAFLEDVLEVKTSIVKTSRIQFFLSQIILKDKEIIAKAKVRIVALNDKRKISRLTKELSFIIFSK